MSRFCRNCGQRLGFDDEGCVCLEGPEVVSEYRMEFENLLGHDAWDNLDMGG